MVFNFFFFNFIIKKVANEIVKPLTMIFNLSISTGIVPEMLKIAKVVPIYKKDDAEKFSNYRPVSLLPCFSKILERLVFNRCVEYIDIHEILNDNLVFVQITQHIWLSYN